MFEAAKIIRKKILQQRKCKFDGNFTGFDNDFIDITETPFSVGFESHVHKETCNKKLVNCFAYLGLSISYDSVIKIKDELGNAVIENISTNQCAFVPPNIGIPFCNIGSDHAFVLNRF